MRATLIALILLLSWAAFADTLNTALEDAGASTTKPFRPGEARFHSSTGTVSLDNAINAQKCLAGLDIWFNPDFDATNVTATYTLFNCPRATASANYAAECLPANFDPDGGGADTNIMTDANDSLHIWNLRVRYFGATITDGDSDTAQATIWCHH
jgi:hypothetical protein